MRHRATTDDPAQGRIVRQPIGVVHVLVASEPAKDGLAKLCDQRVAAVLTRPGLCKDVSGQVCQAESIVEIPEREQSSVGRHARTVECELQAGIERDPESGSFLHPLHRPCPAPLMPITPLKTNSNLGSQIGTLCAHMGNAG